MEEAQTDKIFAALPKAPEHNPVKQAIAKAEELGEKQIATTLAIDEATANQLVKGGFLGVESLCEVDPQDIVDAIGIELDRATQIHTAAKTAMASAQ